MIVIIPLIILVGILTWVLRPRGRLTKPCGIALVATVLPPIMLIISAVVFQLLQNTLGDIYVSDISNTLFVAVLGFIGTGILALAGLALGGKKDMVKTIGFGVCIVVNLTVIELGLLEWLEAVEPVICGPDYL